MNVFRIAAMLGFAVFVVLTAISTYGVARSESTTRAQDVVEVEPAVPVIQPNVRFQTVDVYVDTGDMPLAAYQFSVHSATRSALLAGLEGGEHPAFAPPPYYDPQALIDEKVIVAAFSTADDLPKGRTRVARLHVQVTGEKDAEYVATLQTAAGADGSVIPAKLTVETTNR